MKKFLVGSALLALMIIGFVGCKQVTITGLQKTAPNSEDPISNVTYKIDSNGRLTGYKGNKPSGKIVLPNSVKSIGYSAFSGCVKLTEIKVSESNTTYQGISGVLFSKDKKTLYQYPPAKQGTSYAISNSVTWIGEHAFYGCSGLTSITISDSVTWIGEYAFCDCSELTSVSIPNSVTSIGYNAFDGCNKATIYVPNTTIQNLAKGKGVANDKIKVKTN